MKALPLLTPRKRASGIGQHVAWGQVPEKEMGELLTCERAVKEVRQLAQRKLKAIEARMKALETLHGELSLLINLC